MNLQNIPQLSRLPVREAFYTLKLFNKYFIYREVMTSTSAASVSFVLKVEISLFKLGFFSKTAGEITIYAGLPELLIPLIAGAYKVLEAIKRSDTGNFSNSGTVTWPKNRVPGSGCAGLSASSGKSFRAGSTIFWPKTKPKHRKNFLMNRAL